MHVPVTLSLVGALTGSLPNPGLSADAYLSARIFGAHQASVSITSQSSSAIIESAEFARRIPYYQMLLRLDVLGQANINGPLTAIGNVVLGDAAADSLTINGGTWTIGNNYVATRAAGTVAAGTVIPIENDTTFTGDAGGTTALIGNKWSVTAQGANAISVSRVVDGAGVHAGSNTLTTMRVFNANGLVSSSGNVGTLAYYDSAAPAMSSTGAVTTAIVGLNVRDIGHATLVTGNNIGVRVADQTLGLATLTASFQGQNTSGTAKWNAYMSGNADNAFAGNVRIGSVVAPTVALDVTGSALISSALGVTGTLTGGVIVAATRLDSGAAGSLTLATNNGTAQALVTHTASANRTVNMTGSNGGNPSIGASAGSLALSSNWTAAGRTCADGGTVTTIDINGGTVDGAVIGGASSAAGTFTVATATTRVDSGAAASLVLATNNGTAQANITHTASATRTVNLTGSNGANPAISASAGNLAITSGWTAAGQTCADGGSVTTTDINGGTADGVTIGGASAAAGTFTTLTASSTLTPQALVDISGASAGQVKFPATQNASANANTMDDYRENTWTPVLTFATAGDLNVVYSVQTGTYTKIGRMVILSGAITTSTFTYTTASGAVQITGLPFASLTLANQNWNGCGRWQGITKATYTDIDFRIGSNSSTIVLTASGSGVAVSSVATTDMPSGGTVNFTFTIMYETA